MSLFGAMSTAISGLTAQSSAFSNISDNVANSQTVGYKEVNTSFIDYLTNSTATVNDSGSVVTRPEYANNVQGTITASTNNTALAIAGQGFFPISEQNGTTNGQPTFSPQQYYTRTGDFQMDKNGFLVNSASGFLNGWAIDPQSGVANQNTIAPIQVTQTTFSPIATTQVSLAANLPATPTAGTPISSQINVYDSLGTVHPVVLNWSQNSIGDWTVAIQSPDDTLNPAVGSADVQFGNASGNPVQAGTVGQIGGATGSVTTAGYSANGAATLSFVTNFGSGPQTIQVGLGNYGQTNGVTQFAGTQYQLSSLTQNGVPPGSFASVAMQTNGDVVVNYNNGQSRTIAQIPLITFNDPTGLQSQNGQAFTATLASGAPTANATNTNGAGNLVTNSVEGSNVDIAAEFSKLIVAQRAYSANAKMVTTADDMLTQTIDMKR
jgi:flagellar hook protein FlgE